MRNALGMLGQVSAKPPPTSFPLPERLLQSAEGEDDLEHLLRLAAAAVSRLQSHQLSSLEQTGVTADGRLMSTWQLEIPMRNLQDIVPLQVKFQREEAPEKEPQQERREEREPKQQLWRVDLAFDMEPLGAAAGSGTADQGSLSSQLWAERPYTASLIESNLVGLRATSAGSRAERRRSRLPPRHTAPRPPNPPRTTLGRRKRMKNPNAPRQAIALKYDGTHAPTLTAKGDEELAEDILRIARDHEVPIYENAELVKLLARMELGDSIPRGAVPDDCRDHCVCVESEGQVSGGAGSGCADGREGHHRTRG